MSEYTNAPWRLGELPPNGENYIQNYEGKFVAGVAEYNDNGSLHGYLCDDEEEAKANAQLIVAAPELLEAAQEVIMVMKKIRVFNTSKKAGKNSLSNSLNRLEKAIQKAKGEGDNDE